MGISMNRRDLIGGLAGGAIGLAIGPIALAQVGPPPGKIALRFNENPYGPSPAARKAAFEAVNYGAYYADAVETSLRRGLAELNRVSGDSLVISSGSNEALQAAFTAWGKKGRILMPGLTYDAHVGYAKRMGVEIVTVPLADDLSIDLDKMEATIDDDTSLVFICNPNNPTGHLLDNDRLRDFCKKVSKRATVLIDEAYNEVTDNPAETTLLDLVRDGENVIVTRTFSKVFGMAGMRVGYAMARPDLARQIAGHVMAWANGPGLAAANACYNDDEFINFSRAKIFEAREIVTSTFRRHGVKPIASQSNFMFADIGRNGNEFRHQMAERGVLIQGRYAGYPNYIRVSMGRIEDVEVFSRVFTEVFEAA